MDEGKIRQEYAEALAAFRAATKRLHTARQAYNTLPPATPWHVEREDAIKRAWEMYLAGERDTSVIGHAVNRSRQWVNQHIRRMLYRYQFGPPTRAEYEDYLKWNPEAVKSREKNAIREMFKAHDEALACHEDNASNADNDRNIILWTRP